MRIQRSITIHAPLANVIAFTTDPLNDPAWISDVREVRWISDPPAVPGARAEFIPVAIGRIYQLPAELVSASDAAVEWRAQTRLLTAELRYDYAPSSGHTAPGDATSTRTEFSFTFAADLPLLLRPFGPPLAALLGWRLAGYLRNLKRHLESEPTD